MPGTPRAGSPRRLLSRPGVLRTFVLLLTGRSAYGVLPLCLLFTVRDAADSFAAAASTLAAFGLATLAMPLQSRLVDRHGQARVVPAYAAVFVAILGVVTLLAARSVALPAATWAAAGLVLGLSAPALGPATRAQWRVITGDGALKQTAYALDSVAEESLYLVGPLVAAAVLMVAPAWAGLLLAGVLLAFGVLGILSSPFRPDPAGASTPDESGTEVLGPLRDRGLRTLLILMAASGGTGAAAYTGVAALADDVGRPEYAGYVEASMAVGAVAGGLAWTRLATGAVPWHRMLAALLGVLALASALALAAFPGVLVVAVALALGSLVTSPIYVVAFTAADSMVPDRLRTEASTWVSTSANAGNALGTGLAGVVVALAGPGAPFALASGLGLVGVGLAVRAGRRVARRRTVEA